MEILAVLAAVAFAPVLIDLLSVLGRLGLRRAKPGRPECGTMILVQSISWLGIRWGLRSVSQGFRRAGFDGRCVYWRWHAAWRGWLVLPAIMDADLLERQAARLAAFIVRRRRRRPEAPIYVVGYSCGGYVAIRALELLPAEIAVDGAALLAAAMDPKRDLERARSRLAGPLVVVSSVLDWLIVGLGTLVFGTGDRRHTPSLGMIGRRRAEDQADSRQGAMGPIVEIRWKPSLIGAGNFGGHFSASAARFIHRRVAPAVLRRGGSRRS